MNIKIVIISILILTTFTQTTGQDCTQLSCIATGALKQEYTSRVPYKCMEGYYWGGQSCQPCKPIQGGHYACTSYWGTGTLYCLPGWIILNGVCVNMPNGCLTYQLNKDQNAYICGSCDSGFTLIAGVCVENQQCVTYSSTRYVKNLNCLTCTANGDNSGLQCTSCQSGYVIDSTNNVCVACSSGCTKCTLIAATQNTQQSTSCSNCNDGNYLDNITGRCFACPYDCKTCDTRYTCSTCKDGYYLKQSQTTLNAKQYTFKPCYPCQSNCATCTGPNGNVCLSCSSGYVMQNGGCVNLQQTILNDQNKYNYANCYQLDPNNSGCLNCQAGFYLDAQKVCQECVSPYNNFVCGLKAVSPTNPVGPSPNPTPGPTPTDTTIQIGQNPVPPSSYSIMLGMLIIIVLQ
ncbi:unnamed protein product [Paramecium primaurelia]|uniref:EGF-like domain-containing protein n=1 Tax=Paramecium primaurelia TaxID=5886 RepID=A0A8S1PTK5_PARPR|nr:unnamed protein product [Paramecium primaurelia]